jgi:hypothetical protein
LRDPGISRMSVDVTFRDLVRSIGMPHATHLPVEHRT